MKQLSIIFALLAGLLLGYLVATGAFDDEEARPAISGDMGITPETGDVGETAEQEFDRLVAEAKQEHPDMPTSMAAQKHARAVGAEQLAQARNVTERNVLAASQFWGFLYVNTRARPRYCDDVGVDITPFATAFTNAHSQERAVAERIFTQNNIPLEELWQELEPTLLKAVRQDMLDIQNTNKINAVEACKFFAVNAEKLVEHMLLRDKMPGAHHTLTSLSETP